MIPAVQCPVLQTNANPDPGEWSVIDEFEASRVKSKPENAPLTGNTAIWLICPLPAHPLGLVTVRRVVLPSCNQQRIPGQLARFLISDPVQLRTNRATAGTASSRFAEIVQPL